MVSIRHDILPRNSAGRKPDLAVSVIRPNPNFPFSNIVGGNDQNRITGLTFVPIPGVPRALSF